MPNSISEVVLKKNQQPLVVRVLLQFNLPLCPYPHFGVYSYLFKTKAGITILDTGPYWQRCMGLRPVFMRQTKNPERILQTLEKYFPKTKVNQIILSHYHFDHSETAPALQKELKKRFGFQPPIRVHHCELEPKKYLKFFKFNLEKVFKKAKFRNWTIGKPIKHNELLPGTDFKIQHTPGHTTGCISIVSKSKKVVFGPWWLEDDINKILNFLLRVVDEDRPEMSISKEKLRRPGYKYLFYHPRVNLLARFQHGS